MATGYCGKKVKLVPIDAEKHLETALRWVNNPEITRTLLIGNHPISRAAERSFLESMEKGSDRQVIFAIETLDGRHVGMSGVHDIDSVSRTALTGSFIGDPSDWGLGYGSEAAAIRAAYCFEVLNLRLLKTAFFSGNDRSRRMSEKLGFREYGVLPNAVWKQGKYYDEVLLYLTREAWVEATGGRVPWLEA